MMNCHHQRIAGQILLVEGSYSLSPDRLRDWLAYLTFLGFREAIAPGGKLPAESVPESLLIRILPPEEIVDPVQAIRIARRFLTGRFAIASIAHPLIEHLPDMASFHRERGAPITLAMVQKGFSDRPDIIFDDRNRVVRYHSDPLQGSVRSGWHDGGLYLVEADLFRFIPKEGAESFTDLMRYLLSDAIPIFGYRILDMIPST